MNPDDFEREPRSGNTHLHKLNKNLNPPKKKKNQTHNISIRSLTTFVPFHRAQNHSHEA